MATKERCTAVLDVHPMRRATEKNVIEAVLGRRPGVERVEANPVAQTVMVVYDPREDSLAELRRCVEGCGYRCDGQSVPRALALANSATPARARRRTASAVVAGQRQR